MTDSMRDLLESWKLDGEVIQNFIDNGIETTHLKLLTDDLLRELCPKICTRLYVKRKLQEYLTAETNTSTATNLLTDVELESDLEESSVLEMIACRPPFPDFDLKTLLSTSPTGNSILKYYATQNQLTSKHRNYLTDIISRRIFTRVVNHRMNHEEYNMITAKIIALFPTENAGTYFVPPIKKRDSISGKPGFARGKLVDKIRNTLYKSGERKRKLTDNPGNAKENRHKKTKNLEELEDLHKDHVTWLKNNSEPWEDVISKWKSSCELRQQQDHTTVAAFINSWPILNDIRSTVLINIDFDYIYPERTNNYFLNWNNFIEKIKELKHTNRKEETALIELIDGLTDDDLKVPSQVELLCLLVPPRGRVNKRQKISTKECLESFFVKIEKPGDVQRKIDEVATDAVGHLRSVQPYIIHCAADGDNKGTFYLVIDKVRSLAAIKFTNGESNALVLENIGQAQVRVRRIPENISGVATVSLQAIEESGISDSLRYAGLGAGGHRTGEAKKAFREAVRILIKFASLRNTCILLDTAIRSTLRKVNGIEKVIMPKLQNTENYIQMEMAEREREELHRLKMVKAKKIRAKALAKLRLEHPETGGSGESSEIASCRSASRIRSIECLTSILYTCNSPLSSTTDSAGDYSSYKPTCCPPGWDDEDLLF